MGYNHETIRWLYQDYTYNHYVLRCGRILLVIGLRNAVTSYAVWTGVGAAGAFIAGAIFLGEQITLLRIVSVSLIVLGIVGLRLASD